MKFKRNRNKESKRETEKLVNRMALFTLVVGAVLIPMMVFLAGFNVKSHLYGDAIYDGVLALWWMGIVGAFIAFEIKDAHTNGELDILEKLVNDVEPEPSIFGREEKPRGRSKKQA